MPTLPPVRLPDRGIYVVRVALRRAVTLRVGALGRLRFEAGSYLYVGSAARGLPGRVRRHFRREKPARWHIDSLTAHAPAAQAWAWPEGIVSECAVAGALGRHFEAIPAFGASDCRCSSHLFRVPAGGADWIALTGLPAPPVCISSRHRPWRDGK